MARLTGTGSEAIVSALTDPQIALFDGGSSTEGTGRQVTDWQPYSAQNNTGVRVPERLAEPWVEVRAADGSWFRWPTSPADPGDTVFPPPPSEWFRDVSWTIDPTTLRLVHSEGRSSFTAAEFDQQEWPPCPVCGTPVDVDAINVGTCKNPYSLTPARWQCPHGHDPRPAVEGAALLDEIDAGIYWDLRMQNYRKAPE